MKKLVQDLKSKSVKDLEKDAVNIRQEIAKMSIESAVAPVKDVNSISKKRKQLAIILTIISEKQVEAVSKIKSE